LCVPNFQGIPSATDVADLAYTIKVGNLVESYPFPDINNSECTFSAEIYDEIEGAALPSFFSIVQPTFAPDPVGLDPEIKMMSTPAILLVQTSDVVHNGE